MTFKIVTKVNQSDSRDSRFKAPVDGEEIACWIYAQPEPVAYAVCVIKITQITSDTTFKCIFFNPANGKPFEANIASVDISNISDVWRGFPSTICVPNANHPKHWKLDMTPPAPQNECALLCVSEDWLKINVPPLSDILSQQKGFLIKYPYGEDAATATDLIRRLTTAISNVNSQTNPSKDITIRVKH